MSSGVSPSGSVSLAVTGTDSLRPGRTLTTSATAVGSWLVADGGAMPTRMLPVACAPPASSTR